MAGSHVVISKTVAEKHPVIFEEVKKILEERFGAGEYTIMKLEDLVEKDRDELRQEVKDNVRFFCVHTDDGLGKAADAICELGVPCIVVRGKDIPDEKGWKGILKDLTKEQCRKTLKEPYLDMFYVIPEGKTDQEAAIQAIRGAIKWVNLFYHPLKDNIVNYKLKEFREKYGIWGYQKG